MSMTLDWRRKAAAEAELGDVYLRNSKINIPEDSEPKYVDVLGTLSIKPTITANKVEFFALDNEQYVAFHFDTYCDIHDATSSKDVEGTENNEGVRPNIIASIEACFVAEYKISAELGLNNEKWLVDFAKINASIHVWPYWREFVHDACARLRLPQVVTLPMYPYKSL